MNTSIRRVGHVLDTELLPKSKAEPVRSTQQLEFAVKRESAVERRLGRDSRREKEAWLRKAGSGARDDG